MGFFDSVWDGIQKPFVFVYDHGIKPVVNRIDKIGGIIDHTLDKVPGLVDGAAGAVTGLMGLLNPTNIMLVGGGILLIMILK